MYLTGALRGLGLATATIDVLGFARHYLSEEGTYDRESMCIYNAIPAGMDRKRVPADRKRKFRNRRPYGVDGDGYGRARRFFSDEISLHSPNR